MKKRDNKQYEKKVWIPIPDGATTDKNSSSVRFNKLKNIYEKRQSFYDVDKVRLKATVNEIENQILKGTYVLDNDITFKQVSEKWYKVHAAAKEETTRESYDIYKKHAIKLMGDKTIQGIKPSDVKEAYNNFLFKLDDSGNKIELHSKNSLKHLHTIVNMVFKFAIEDNILYKNPCDSLNKKEMRPDEFEPYVYTEKEFNTLLKKVKGTKVEIIAMLAGGIGMRAGEMCALKKDKINIEMNQIAIVESKYRTKGKTGEKKTKSKNRTIFIDPHIIKIITENWDDGEYVISRSTGKPYRNDELYHMFTDALTLHNLPKTRLHDLRHYNATQMALHGIDIKTAAYRLGDSPATVLKIYQHVQEQMDRNASEKLGKMFKDKSNPDDKKDKSVVNTVVNIEKEKDLLTTEIASNPSLN